MLGGWCVECGKKMIEREGNFSTIIYDKCRGKTCPDCRKVRKLGTIETIDWGKAITARCLGCSEMTRFFVRRLGKKGEGVCWKCFLEQVGKDGCICFDTKGILLCSICDEVHAQPRLCEECLKKQTISYQRKQTFLKVVLPTMIVSLIIGFLLGWLFLVRLRRKKPLKRDL